MKPKYLNPYPENTKKSLDLEEMPTTVKYQLDDDWTVSSKYAIDGRRGYLKYHHVNISGKTGVLESRPYVTYRLFSGIVEDVILSTKDNLYFTNCFVQCLHDGNKTNVTLRDCKINEIKDNINCNIIIENCDIRTLVVHDNINCQISFVDSRGKTDSVYNDRDIPLDPRSEEETKQAALAGIFALPENPAVLDVLNSKISLHIDNTTYTDKSIRQKSVLVNLNEEAAIHGRAHGVIVEADTDFNFEDEDFCIELMLETTQTSKVCLVRKGNEELDPGSWYILLNTRGPGSINFYVREFSTKKPLLATVDERIISGEKVHIAIDRYGNTQNLFIDSKLRSTRKWHGRIKKYSHELIIGGKTPLSEAFEGNYTLAITTASRFSEDAETAAGSYIPNLSLMNAPGEKSPKFRAFDDYGNDLRVIKERNIQKLPIFVIHNTQCKIRMVGITYQGGGAAIKENNNCDFWLEESNFYTPWFTFRSNMNCHSRLLNCETQGNFWIVLGDKACEYVCRGGIHGPIGAFDPHGFNGDKLTLFMKEDTIFLPKIYRLRNSYLSVERSKIYGQIVFLEKKSQSYIIKSEIKGFQFISNSKESQFNFNDCKIECDDVIFEDEDCMHDFHTCELKSPLNNFNVKGCKTKATNTRMESTSEKNFEGSGSSVTLMACKLIAKPFNIVGQYVLMQAESCSLKAIDGFNAYAEKWIWKRTAMGHKHPLKPFSCGFAQIEKCTFQGHSYWTGADRAYQQDNVWGPVDFSNIREMHEKGDMYGDIASFARVNTWAIDNIYTNIVNVTESVHFLTDKSLYGGITTVLDSHFSSSYSKHEALVSITDCVVDFKAVKAPIVNISSVTLTSHGVDLGILNMSSSSLQSWMGKFGTIEVDPASTTMLYGATAIINTPAKSGVECTPGSIVQASGSMYKESIGADHRIWVNGTRHERISGDSLHRVEGNTNWATEGSAVYQSNGAIDITSPPRTPMLWTGGSYSPVEEPPP